MDAITFIDCFMAIPIAKRAFLLVSGPKRALYELFSRGAKGTKGELKKHLWERANDVTNFPVTTLDTLTIMLKNK